MPVSGAIRRLLRMRGSIEEQHRTELELAVGELLRLEHALDASRESIRAGRKTVAASARSGDVVDRIAGLVNEGAAQRRAETLVTRIGAAESEAERRRLQYLEKRIERRQAETLIRETEARDALEAGRREQQHLDDWFGSRGRDRGRSERPGAEHAESNRSDGAEV
ncbi:MAG TPA: hypothetical protein VKB38_02885 [Terracidiphilus sp.]|nr:hypothetical protein [Terracidiphilus sp.]